MYYIHTYIHTYIQYIYNMYTYIYYLAFFPYDGYYYSETDRTGTVIQKTILY